MKKNFLIIAVMMLLGLAAIAQDTIVEPVQPQPKEKKQKKQKQPIGQKMYFGGNLGLTFGTYTRIGLYPLVGYKFNPKFSGGVKVLYEYVKDNYYTPAYESSNYGGSLFTRYRILPSMYLHAEYEMVSFELFGINGEKSREWVPFLYLGGGYSQNLGGNAWLNFQVLFDVLQDSRSPYRQWEPIFSVGVGVGF
ncbi:MAG: hypothetical protein GXO89_13415 [Chlorobi bacterium]|nr:hypothetical protein [Chlorobiota bacterium]